jgi:hypothetical protein
MTSDKWVSPRSNGFRRCDQRLVERRIGFSSLGHTLFLICGKSQCTLPSTRSMLGRGLVEVIFCLFFWPFQFIFSIYIILYFFFFFFLFFVFSFIFLSFLDNTYSRFRFFLFFNSGLVEYYIFSKVFIF